MFKSTADRICLTLLIPWFIWLFFQPWVALIFAIPYFVLWGSSLKLLIKWFPPPNHVPGPVFMTKTPVPDKEGLVTAIIKVYPHGIKMFSNGNTVEVVFDVMGEILYETQVVQGRAVAGFQINYSDVSGHHRLFFYENGIDASAKVERMVSTIQEAHNKWYEGTDVPQLAAYEMQEGAIKLP